MSTSSASASRLQRVPALLALALALAGGFEAAWSGRLTPALYLFFLVLVTTFGAGRFPPALWRVPLRRPLLLAGAAVLGPIEAMALLVLVAVGANRSGPRSTGRFAIGDLVATVVSATLLTALRGSFGEQSWAAIIGVVSVSWLSGVLADREVAAHDRRCRNRSSAPVLAGIWPGLSNLLREYGATLAMAVPLSQLTLLPGIAVPLALLASVAAGTLLLSLTERRLERSRREIWRLRSVREELQAQQLGTVKALMGSMASRLGQDSSGLARIGFISRRIAALAGLGPDEAHEIELAALLRDAGCIFLSGFGEAQAGLVSANLHQEHVVNGCSLLSAAGLPAAVVEAVYAHHENWDGSGYPRHLAAAGIPAGGRILALAEFLDDLRMDSVDPDLGFVRACLMEAAGKTLDPALCERVLAHVEEIRWITSHTDSSLSGEPAFAFLQARSRHRAVQRERLDLAKERVLALLATRVFVDDPLFDLVCRELSQVLPLQHLALFASATASEEARMLASTGLSLEVAVAIQKAANDSGVRVPGSVIAQVPGEDVYLVASTRRETDDLDDLGLAVAGMAHHLLQHVRASRAIGSAVVSSLTDPLTGIGNRRALDLGLEQALDVAAHTGIPFSVLMLDLNELKLLNDSYGHSLGDQAIRAVASALQSVVRSRDVAARFGGDEFAAVLQACGQEGVERAMARLLEAAGNTSLRLPEGEIWMLGVAVGAASWPADGETAAELLAAADARMYRHKEQIKQASHEDVQYTQAEARITRSSA
jgi:diguanylate cyclase (GGDEF)-like protein